jgi:hypothetical protein
MCCLTLRKLLANKMTNKMTVENILLICHFCKVSFMMKSVMTKRLKTNLKTNLSMNLMKQGLYKAMDHSKTKLTTG